MSGTLPIPAIGSPNSTEDQDIADALTTLNGLLTASNKLDGAQIGAGTIPSATALDRVLSSGLYTPTITDGANTDGTPSVNECQYLRVGDVITVSGSVFVDPTAADTQTDFEMSLPIASDLTATSDLAGTIAAVTHNGVGLAGRGRPRVIEHHTAHA